jgi:hypothetical protein
MQMQKLISELIRLYLPEGIFSRDMLAQRMLGQSCAAIDLSDDDGTRAIVITFPKMQGGEDDQHWSLLCKVANALQTELGFPAPAVSVSGIDGYGLWLSLGSPVPQVQARQFVELLRTAYFPEVDPGAVSAPVELPPCLDQNSGKWAAFIHPGMGASFADESGLEMAPPFAGQSAFLEGLHCISAAQFQHALNTLQQAQSTPTAISVSALVAAHAVAPEGLLLKDATLEDIVQFLHSKQIEPTFRHLIR